jgi:hypothetical protein
VDILAASSDKDTQALVGDAPIGIEAAGWVANEST